MIMGEPTSVITDDEVDRLFRMIGDMKARGVAGEIFMWKCGGAKAAKGGNLDEVIAAAQKAIDNCRSVGTGLTLCTLPAVGHLNFEIKDGTMEVAVLVSGLGATPVMELYVLYNEIYKLLSEKGIKTYRSYAGNYFTSFEPGCASQPKVDRIREIES